MWKFNKKVSFLPKRYLEAMLKFWEFPNQSNFIEMLQDVTLDTIDEIYAVYKPSKFLCCLNNFM